VQRATPSRTTKHHRPNEIYRMSQRQQACQSLKRDGQLTKRDNCATDKHHRYANERLVENKIVIAWRKCVCVCVCAI